MISFGDKIKLNYTRSFTDVNGIKQYLIDDVAFELGYIKVVSFDNNTNSIIADIEAINQLMAPYHQFHIKPGNYITENMLMRLIQLSNTRITARYKKQIENEVIPYLKKNGVYHENAPTSCPSVEQNPYNFVATQANNCVYMPLSQCNTYREQYLKNIEPNQKPVIIAKDPPKDGYLPE